MKSIRTVTTVETHTEGMPTRVVTSGMGEIPGATMFDKRLHFMEHMDYWRQDKEYYQQYRYHTFLHESTITSNSNLGTI